MSSEDREAQEDELLALASIYDEDEFRRAESDQGGEIRICFTLSHNFKVVMAGANGQLEYFVDFLPPIVLNFELPPDYPSASAPVFTLSCKWLSEIQLSALCKQLDEVWQENQGCVVLFSWMQFLKEEALSFLKVKSPLELKNTVIRRQDQRCLALNNDELCSFTKVEKDASYDPRAIQDVESWTDVLPEILDFDQQQKQKCFDSKVYLCSICFLEKLGSDCLYFTECKHVYCKACLKEYFEIQIREGSVHCLNCPEPKCSSVATPAQVKNLVGEDLFTRYDRLLLQSSLDLMADVVYCPRPSCQTAVMQEPGCTMGVCSCCLYAFCTVCKMAYHGIHPCRVTAAKLRDLCIDYRKADEETKAFLEQRYGKAVIQKAIDELDSEDWLAENLKTLLCALFLTCCLMHVDAHDERIIGGQEAKPHSRPYMAFLYLSKTAQGNDSCGGFLVKKNFVITAAHCKGEATVILGAHNINIAEKTQQVIKVAEYIRHENYSSRFYWNDIMLLKLKRKAKLTKEVQTLKLPKNSKDIVPRTKCNVAGWGRVSAKPPISSTLQEVDMYVMNRTICTGYSNLDDTVLCVGDSTKNKTTFKGDSGGPLVCSGIAQGIVSHGIKGKAIPPRIFTRINKYLDWIKMKMK